VVILEIKLSRWYLKEVEWECVSRIYLVQIRESGGYWGHGNDHSDVINGGQFDDWLRNCQLLKKDHMELVFRTSSCAWAMYAWPHAYWPKFLNEFWWNLILAADCTASFMFFHTDTGNSLSHRPMKLKLNFVTNLQIHLFA
jgi:hypothetical protein